MVPGCERRTGNHKILGHRAFQINTAQKISRCEVSECLSF